VRLVVVVVPVLVGCAVILAMSAEDAAALTTQDEVTVDELVTRALADNPDVRAVRLDVEAAEGRLRQAGLRPNPMLDLGGQKALSPDNNLTIGVTVPLDLNGRKEGRVGVAEREVEIKRALVRERERRLRADVRMKAGELLAAHRNLAVTDDLLRVNREAFALIGERARRGAVPPLEASLLEVEVNRLDASQRLLAGRVEVLTLQLKSLAGMPPDVALTLRGDLTGPRLAVDRAEAVREALAGRADLDAARAEAAMAKAQVRKERAEGRWDASINVGYQRQDVGFPINGLTSSGATRPIQDVFHYFGGGVSITLPVRNQNQGNIAAALATAKAAERRVDGASLTVRQEVEAAFAQYTAAARALAVYERGVRDTAQRNLDVVRQTYQLGRTTLLDVIAEQRRFIDVEMGYTESLKQVYDAAVDVDRVVGKVAR
jgi:cobalt-zinc-cadmium efflux system outer membrane protein